MASNVLVICYRDDGGRYVYCALAKERFVSERRLGELEKEYPYIVVNYKDILCIRTKVPNPPGLTASSERVRIVKPVFSNYEYEIKSMFRFCQRVTAHFIDGYIYVRLVQDQYGVLLLQMNTATSGASGTPALRKLQDELDKLTRRIDDMQASTPAAPPVQSQLHAQAGVPHGGRAIADNIKRLRYELIRLKDSREFTNMQILNFRYPKNEEKGRRALRSLQDHLRSMDEEIRRVEDEIGDLRQQQLESPHPVGAFMGARALEDVQADIAAIQDNISQLKREFTDCKYRENMLDEKVKAYEEEIDDMKRTGNYEVPDLRQKQREQEQVRKESNRLLAYCDAITARIKAQKTLFNDLNYELSGFQTARSTPPPASGP